MNQEASTSSSSSASLLEGGLYSSNHTYTVTHHFTGRNGLNLVCIFVGMRDGQKVLGLFFFIGQV